MAKKLIAKGAKRSGKSTITKKPFQGTVTAKEVKPPRK
jgi:hypothetical protein